MSTYAHRIKCAKPHKDNLKSGRQSVIIFIGQNTRKKYLYKRSFRRESLQALFSCYFPFAPLPFFLMFHHFTIPACSSLSRAEMAHYTFILVFFPYSIILIFHSFLRWGCSHRTFSREISPAVKGRTRQDSLRSLLPSGGKPRNAIVNGEPLKLSLCRENHQ